MGIYGNLTTKHWMKTVLFFSFLSFVFLLFLLPLIALIVLMVLVLFMVLIVHIVFFCFIFLLLLVSAKPGGLPKVRHPLLGRCQVLPRLWPQARWSRWSPGDATVPRKDPTCLENDVKPWDYIILDYIIFWDYINYSTGPPINLGWHWFHHITSMFCRMIYLTGREIEVPFMSPWISTNCSLTSISKKCNPRMPSFQDDEHCQPRISKHWLIQNRWFPRKSLDHLRQAPPKPAVESTAKPQAMLGKWGGHNNYQQRFPNLSSQQSLVPRSASTWTVFAFGKLT